MGQSNIAVSGYESSSIASSMFERNISQDLKQPAVSICIPQFNRTSFLLKALESFREQTFKNFEICISDDCSTDGRVDELLDYLKNSGMSFRYHRLEQNGRYDKNIRSSINLAQGRFCMLMGNDDKFADRASLERIWAQLQKHNWPEVAITNYQELASGRVFRRICNTGIVGSGPEIAANNYRNFSFVSGILLDRELAHKHVTDKWDGSEMYQMFVGTRMIAAGGRLLGIAEVLVGKDIQIPGESVDS